MFRSRFELGASPIEVKSVTTSPVFLNSTNMIRAIRHARLQVRSEALRVFQKNLLLPWEPR